MSFLAYIHKHLQVHKQISFAEFMKLALYAPKYGYYTSGLPKFGKYGDFITAPELTPLFGRTLANQCQQILSNLQDPIILEFGAGTGRLCVDVLLHLEQLHCLPKEYHIFEISPALRKAQKASIKSNLPHLFDRIKWLTKWPTTTFEGVILANEVLDAMPVHRFLQTETQILESYITLSKENALLEILLPSSSKALIHHIRQIIPPNVFPYLSEVNLALESWLRKCSKILHAGGMLVLDYGFPRHEYYHLERNTGTLMCHYQHYAHTNPLAHPGEEDITAHVDFTHVAEAASAAGFHVAGYTNQASFLLWNDLLGLLASETKDISQDYANKQAVKQLTDPTEMGELFKVIALTKRLDIDLQGFRYNDKRVSL